MTEAATDARVGAVVADGLQGRTTADASHLGFGNRISLEPAFAVAGAEIRLVRGEAKPRPLFDLVREAAHTQPLLLIGTVAYEREFERAYTRGTRAQLWELPQTGHTQGLREHPAAYRARVLALFRRGLAPRQAAHHVRLGDTKFGIGKPERATKTPIPKPFRALRYE